MGVGNESLRRANDVSHACKATSWLCLEYTYLEVQVRKVITGLVIVHIIRHARLATEQGRFLLRLNTLGTSEQPTSSDSDVKESAIVAAPVKIRGREIQAASLEPVLEEVLSFRTAGWAGDVEAGAVAVVDSVVVVLFGSVLVHVVVTSIV